MLKVLAVLGVCLPLAYAQSGAVQSGGQPIPGVTIRATQGERALSTISDDNGAFQFAGMMPGTWSIEADLFGFEPYKKDVTIAEMPTRIDIALVLQGKGQITQQRNPGGGGGRGGGGQPAQELIAEAPPELAPQVNSSTANDSFQIAGTVSTGLETNNRDFQGGNNGFGGPDFNPGGQGGDFNNGQGGPGGPGGPGGQQNGGGRGNRNGGGGDFNGGGGGNFNGGGGGRGGGGGGGRGGGGGGNGRGGRGGQQARGLIGNRSKQGANQIRINAFDTVQDSALDARNYAINGNSTPKPQSESNRYGINIGGPLIIPHVVDLSKQINFTVNYTGTIANTARNNFSTLPTAAEQGGNFSALSTPIYDPLSGGTTQFPNNQIPVTRLNPIALGLEQQQYIPLPNQITPTGSNNYQFVAAPPTNNQSISIRLQVTVDPKNRLSIQSQTTDSHSQSAQPFGFIDKTAGFGQNQSVQWTHNFTPRVFNTFQVGLNRNANTGTPYFETLGNNIAGKLGIAGTWPDPSNYGPPTLSFGSGFTGLSDGTPSHTVVQTLSLQNSLQWRRGKHNLTFGALYGRLDQNYLTDTAGRGSFSFTGAATQQVVNGLGVTGTGNGYADFLLGLPQTDSVTWGDTRYYRQLNYSMYVNDDYRLFSNLSLSLGVRYEYTSPTDEKYGRLANLELASGFGNIASVVTGTPITPPQSCTSLAAGIPCVLAGAAGVPNALVQAQHGAVEPRIGFAWQASKRGSLLIRGGYGTYYNEGIYNGISNALGRQPEFVHASGSLQTDANNVLTLANGLTQIAPGTSISNTTAYDPNYKIPFTQTWNASLQRNLPNQLVLQINYTGIKTTHLNLAFDPNQAPPGSLTNVTSRFPMLYAGLFTYNESGANMYSNTESVSLQRRMRNNVSFQLQYTLAKSIDDAVTALNPLDIKAEYANTSGVRRNQVTYTMVLESPVDQRKGFLANKGFLTKALKDWTIQTPISWGSGSPLTATVNGDVAGIGTTATERAEATGLPVNSGSGFFNLGAFTTPAAGTFGNAGRNTILGPDSFSFNANMSRTIQIKERKSLEIQINSTNILNHPVPTSFGTVVNNPLTYGVLQNMNGMRVISGTIRFRM